MCFFMSLIPATILMVLGFFVMRKVWQQQALRPVSAPLTFFPQETITHYGFADDHGLEFTDLCLS